MKKVNFIRALEAEAEDCERSALLNSSPTAETLHILAIFCRSLANRFRDEAEFSEIEYKKALEELRKENCACKNQT